MLTYFDGVIISTEEMLRLIPSDKLEWKPTENSFTVGQLLAHLTGALGVYARGIAKGEWGFKSMRERFVLNRRTPPMNVEDAIAALKSGHEEFRSLLGSLSEDEFRNSEIDSPQFGIAPRWRLVMLAIEHHLNHRAEMFMYLKLLGVNVNTGNLYRR